jgi:excisionase family DNA binding protein
MLQTSAFQDSLAARTSSDVVATALTPMAYSIDDVTRVARIGKTSIFGAIRDGELRAIKIGRRTLIRAADLKIWLDRAEVIEPHAAA